VKEGIIGMTLGRPFMVDKVLEFQVERIEEDAFLGVDLIG
jgi:hypothetical protein